MAAAAIVAVLSAGVLAGVVIGIALSLVWLVYVTTTPQMPLLGREPGTQRLPRRADRATRRTRATPSCDSTAACSSRPPKRSTSASATLVQDADPPLRAVVLDMEGVDFVDSQGAAMLAEILDFTESADVRMSLARVKPAVAQVLGSDGVLDRLGPDRVHASLPLAVDAQLAADRRLTLSRRARRGRTGRRSARDGGRGR